MTASTRIITDIDQKRDLGESASNAVIEKCLKVFGLTQKDLSAISKSDPRKMLIAGLLRYHYPVSVTWVSEKLMMGAFLYGKQGNAFL